MYREDTTCGLCLRRQSRQKFCQAATPSRMGDKAQETRLAYCQTDAKLSLAEAANFLERTRSQRFEKPSLTCLQHDLHVSRPGHAFNDCQRGMKYAQEMLFPRAGQIRTRQVPLQPCDEDFPVTTGLDDRHDVCRAPDP